MKFFVALGRANDLRNIAPVFNQNEFANRSDVGASGRAGNSQSVAGRIERRHARGRTDQSIPDVLPNIRLLLVPAFWQVIAFKLFDVDRQDRFRLLWQPLAFAWWFRDQRKNDREQRDHRHTAEIKLSQL